MTIRKRNSKYVVISSTKGVVGTHKTKKKAQAQHRAIEASKARRKKSKKRRR